MRVRLGLPFAGVGPARYGGATSAEAALALERLAYGMLGQTGEHGAATSEFTRTRGSSARPPA